MTHPTLRFGSGYGRTRKYRGQFAQYLEVINPCLSLSTLPDLFKKLSMILLLYGISVPPPTVPSVAYRGHLALYNNRKTANYAQ